MDLEIGDEVAIIITHDGWDFDWPCKVIDRESCDYPEDREQWVLKEMKGFRKKTDLTPPRSTHRVLVGEDKTRGGELPIRKGHTEEDKELYWVGEMVPEDQPDFLLYIEESVNFSTKELQLSWRGICQRIHREDYDFQKTFYVQHPTDPEELVTPDEAKEMLKEKWKVDSGVIGIRINPEYRDRLDF